VPHKTSQILFRQRARYEPQSIKPLILPRPACLMSTDQDVEEAPLRDDNWQYGKLVQVGTLSAPSLPSSTNHHHHHIDNLPHSFITMSFSAFRSLALFGASALAQQYAGEAIQNSLPAVAGAELAYFRISDPAGANTATLLNYQSLGSDGQRLKEANVERAVIMVHGQRRDADVYASYVSLLC